MRILLGVVLLLAAGCTRKKATDPAATLEAPATTPADQSTGTPLLALPVVAPMQARERLLHDMEKQKAAARARSAQFDAVIEGRDR